MLIYEKIKILYVKHKGRYGIDRMTHALFNDFKLQVNHKHVYKLMKEHDCLAVIKAKKHFKQPERRHSGIIYLIGILKLATYLTSLQPMLVLLKRVEKAFVNHQ